MKKTHDIIKELRTRKNLTQKELGDYTGISQGTIASIESGKSSPRINQLYFICDALNITLIDLLMRSEDTNNYEECFKNFFDHLELYLTSKNVNPKSVETSMKHVKTAYKTY